MANIIVDPLETDPIDLLAIRRKTVILTDEQIKALPTTPFEILPAPGVGKVISGIGGIYILDSSAGSYDNIDDTGIINLVHGDNERDASNYVQASAWLTTQKKITTITPAAYPSGSILHENVGPLAFAENLPIKLAVYNNTLGNWTGGNAANTLKITVLYMIVDL